MKNQMEDQKHLRNDMCSEKTINKLTYNGQKEVESFHKQKI